MAYYSGRFSRNPLRDFAIDEENRYRINVSPYDLIIPIALTPPGTKHHRHVNWFFPAKLDTGFSGSLHISRGHFISWAKWKKKPKPQSKKTYKYADEDSEEFPTYFGNLWLANTERDGFRQLASVEFTIGDYISIEGNEIPRIPLIGQTAMQLSRASLAIEYAAFDEETETMPFHIDLP